MSDFIQKQLVYNILMDICEKAEHIIFSDSWCSHEKTVRFTTDFFRSNFNVKNVRNSRWKTIDVVMYEVEILDDKLEINCVYNDNGTKVDNKEMLTKALNKELDDKQFLINTWEINENNTNTMLKRFVEFINVQLINFEVELKNKLDNEVYIEGKQVEILCKKYERNKKAREACINYHGSTCKVCGYNFGKTFGNEFSNLIEVHHIKPLSVIKKDYIVDPIIDLVPICSNCHYAIHNKTDGVYSIEQLSQLLNRDKN